MNNLVCVFEDEDEDEEIISKHFFPHEDLDIHEESPFCWCNPIVLRNIGTEKDSIIYIHKSALEQLH